MLASKDMAHVNKELKSIRELFSGSSIVYWLDSGTLLGLHRDGELIKWDGDVDIGVWVSDANKVLTVLKGNAVECFDIQIWRLKNVPYKVKLVPRHEDSQGWPARTIDINFFSPGDDGFATCPIMPTIWRACRKNPRESVLRNWYRPQVFLPLAAYVFDRLVGRFRQKQAGPNSGVGLRRLFEVPWRWRIPMKYFTELSQFGETGCLAPTLVDEYLEYRYGLWSEPIQDWYYLHDDGGVDRVGGWPRCECL